MDIEITPKFRVSYPSVFKPKINNLNKKEEYSLTALFDFAPNSPEFAKLKALAEKAMIKKWGKDKTQWPKMTKNPFRDQGEREKNVDGKLILPAGYAQGKAFITLKSYTRPGVVDQQVKPILDETEFYSGCFAIAAVTASTFDQAGNRGVSFWLKNVQKVAEGEPLAGSIKPEDSFSPVAVGEGEVNSADELFK